MAAPEFLKTLEEIRKKLDWANRYSDRLVKLSDKVFVLRISLSKDKEDYWNDDEYIKLGEFNKKINCKIDVLARYGNIIARKVFDQLRT